MKNLRKTLAVAAMGGAMALAPMALATGTAHADSGVNWDAVAQCESGGNWGANTGNGLTNRHSNAACTLNPYRKVTAPISARISQPTIS